MKKLIDFICENFGIVDIDYNKLFNSQYIKGIANRNLILSYNLWKKCI